MKALNPFRILLVLLCCGHFCLYLNCKTAETNSTIDEAKALAELKALLQDRQYRIDVHTIHPTTTAASTQVMQTVLQNSGNSVNRIDVRGDGNFLSVQDSTAASYLPYFGEQQMSTGNYGGTDSAIQLDGTVEDYNIDSPRNKDAFTVTFTANQKNHSTESFKVSMLVFLNKHVEITVVSSHRHSIRYHGKLTMVDMLAE